MIGRWGSSVGGLVLHELGPLTTTLVSPAEMWIDRCAVAAIGVPDFST